MKNERDKNGKTELLYETEGMLTEFDAVVTEASSENGKNYVVLDRTAFFPEGGGQDADTGVLESCDAGTVKVTDVRTVDGTVRHYTDGAIPKNSIVKGKIDSEARFSRMQCHGAEHLISGIIHNMFGYDNVGFHTTKEGYVIDISGPLSDAQIREVEERANRAVFENVPVTISFPTFEEAMDIDYRSKLDISDNIRLVTIEGYDVCACCAPHLSSTGRFGVIKIIDSMPHRGGMRLTMIAGMDAYRDYAMLHDDNAKIMKLLSAPRTAAAEFTKDLAGRMTGLKEEINELKKKITALETGAALDLLAKRDEGDTSPYLVFSDCLDPVGLRELVNACTKKAPGIVCAFSGGDNAKRYIFAVGEDKKDRFDLLSLVADFNEKCCGKGGGSAVMAQGTCTMNRGLIESYFEKSG